MLPLDAWTLPHLFWLVPLLFALHNAEEAPRMATWVRRVTPRFMPPITAFQFAVAVALLTLLVLLLTLAAARALPLRLGVLLMAGVQAIIFVNALTHVGSALWYRGYTPGLATAVLLTVPFSLYLFHRLLASPHLSGTGLGVALAIAPLLMVALTRSALYVGAVVERRWRGPA